MFGTLLSGLGQESSSNPSDMHKIYRFDWDLPLCTWQILAEVQAARKRRGRALGFDHRGSILDHF